MQLSIMQFSAALAQMKKREKLPNSWTYDIFTSRKLIEIKIKICSIQICYISETTKFCFVNLKTKFT